MVVHVHGGNFGKLLPHTETTAAFSMSHYQQLDVWMLFTVIIIVHILEGQVWGLCGFTTQLVAGCWFGKLVSIEPVSLQQKSVSQSSPTAKTNKSDLSSSLIANYRPSYLHANIIVDLTLAPHVYRTTHRAHWKRRGRRSLRHRFRCFQPALWLRMATEESRSNNLHLTPGHTDRQKDRQM